MVPRQSYNSEQNTARDEAVEEVDEQNSFDLNTVDMLKKAQDMVLLSKKRREGKRKVIEDEHEQMSKDVAIKINTLFETRKNRVFKSQKAIWDRLDALNKERTNLESLILAKMRSIEQHSANIANEMGAMFGGRIEEIQENSTPHDAK